MKELIEEVADPGYGCAVANRFGQLLDDEGDPFDLLYQAQVQGEKKKKKEELKKVATTVSKPNKKESQKDRKALPRTTENPAKPAQGQKRPVRPQPEEKVDRRVAFSESKFNEAGESLGYSIERPVELSDRGVRGRGGGRGRGARGFGYSRSNDGFDPRGKREFERHSGSDRASVRPEEKRGGSGPRNWGSMRDHVSAVADAAPTEESAESEEVTETTEADLENGPVETEEVLEVALEMSLDEWKAMQEQSRPKVDFNIRKADTKIPPKAVVIHKSKRIECQGQELDEDDSGCRRPANDITCQVDINFGSLGRPSRGGRGGRGGRGRGAASATTAERSPQKYAPNVQAPNPDDPEDFPALA